jgi:hypothetical protein
MQLGDGDVEVLGRGLGIVSHVISPCLRFPAAAGLEGRFSIWRITRERP